VKPETAAFLAKARQFLEKAHDLFGVHHWPDETGRAAYLAGLHAARAFIFETTGEVTKSHRRAQNEFRRLVKDDPRVDMELRAFLGRTFEVFRSEMIGVFLLLYHFNNLFLLRVVVRLR